jgi:eukaryotic-like serine/threonine-protein kinase
VDFDDILSDSLSPEQLHEIDQRCDWYCAMVRNGQAPRPADFTRGLDDRARDFLLEQLRLLQQELDETSAAPAAVAHAHSSRDDAASATARSRRRYQILRPHAQGGLGIVSVAHDGQLDREVAVKEIHAAYTAHAATRQRFLREAEITGSLEHPGIVPVYSLEQHDDGRPYYAMRFIRGESLRDAVRRFHGDDASGRHRPRQKLELRKLLARFVAVCNAVQYAHSRHVLHRDLKPDNVMLGEHGETLVVDWGLAKRMKAEGGSQQGELPPSSFGPHPSETQAGQVLGTLAYMSPEQASGQTDRWEPASDIYSLGATLYCLLTGTPPFPDEDPADALEKVCTGDFPRPHAIRPATPKPLEAICLKALALRPDDRYESARALADDIERYLGNEPVLAWREPLTIRTHRWIQRHCTSVAVAVVLMLVAGAGLVAHYQHRARAAEQAQTLADDQPLTLPLRQQMREMARDFRLLQQLDRAEMAKAELDVRQNTFHLLAALPEYRQAFREYGIDPEQTPLDDAAILLAQRPPRVRLILVAALDDWATLLRRHAGALGAGLPTPPNPMTAGLPTPDSPPPSPPQAGSLRHVTSRAWLEALVDKVDPDPLRSQLRQAIRSQQTAALERLAQQAEMLEQPPRVLKLVASVLYEAGRMEAAVGLLRRTQSKYPGDFWSNTNLAQSLYALSPPQYGEALRFYTCALAVRPDAAGVLLNSGNALYGLGRYDEAAAMLRRALELRQDYAPAHCNLGSVRWKQGDADEAIRQYRRAIELKPEYAEAHCNLGNVFLERGQLDEASQEYCTAIKLKPDYAKPVFNRGVTLQRQGQLDEAIRQYRKATELQPDDPGMRCRLAQALAIAGHVDEAILQCRRVIEQEPDYAEAYCELGVAFSRQGQLDEAIEQYRKAIQAKPDEIQAHGNLAIALQMQGKLREATEQYRKVLELQPDGALTYYNLGNLLKAQGQLDEAVTHYRRALELAPDYAEAHCNLAGALRDQGRFAESLAAYQCGHRLGSQRADWPYPSEPWVQRAEELVALENKLSAIAAGQTHPEHAAERLQLANDICLPQQRYVTAVRLFQEAFAEDARLADQSAHRYHAACCAALAGSGQGQGAELLDDAELVPMRQQAIRWLQAELLRYSPALAGSDPKIQADALAQLRHWQTDRDLAGIREADSLAALPPDERAACQQFWEEVRLATRP